MYTHRFPNPRRVILLLVFGLGLSACSKPAAESGAADDAAERAVPVPDMVRVSGKADIEPLFSAIADRRFVLMGEATHGTHEFYDWRDRISRRLIREQRFRFVAVEGDWPSICRLNQYVKHRTPEDLDLRTLLLGLDRWPQWMWANEEFAAFLEWLREKNASRAEADRIGVYGLDMQDPTASMAAVVQWFERHEPETADAVKARYQLLYGLPDGFRRYAQRLAQGGARVRNDLIHVAERLIERHAAAPDDPLLFSAKMNALAVVSAEAQHAEMVRGGPGSWNVRARFMDDAVRRLAVWYGEGSRGIVWAHNTHVGDAAATEMLDRGEVNIGQLLRQDYGSDQVYILGFATTRGTVVAGGNWGAPMQTMTIAPPRHGSLEAALHARDIDQALFFFTPDGDRPEWNTMVPHRAIGVVYRPPHEAYVMTRPARRYDALFYIRDTRALTPVQPER